jgi:tRNA (cmo5U34)-methyltransferase
VTVTRDRNIHETMDHRWEFNGEVTKVFDEMLERSIPQLQTMRQTVFSLARRLVAANTGSPGGLVVDLGCSNGGSLAPFLQDGWTAVGLEASEPMIEAAEDRFQDELRDERLEIRQHDLREPFTSPGPADAVLAVLTLMFTPINYRQRIVRNAFEQMRSGAPFVVVEKLLGNGSTLDQAFVDLYHDAKEQAGYSREEIDRKAMALEGVQVPVTADWNADLLRQAGFREVDTFWRWANFAGFVAVKP